jgi:putative nucleotidyltransferase with HDIG domain
MIEQIEESIINIFSESPNKTEHHSFYHTLRVVQNARIIAEDVGLSEENQILLRLSAMLHDIGRLFESQDIGQKLVITFHAELSAKFSRKFLKKFDFKPAQKKEIIQAIVHHVDKRPAPTLIGMILQDADKIDGLGDIGYERIIRYRSNYNLEDIERFLKTQNYPATAKDSLKRIYDDLSRTCEWYEMMNFEKSKLIAHHHFIKSLYNKLKLAKLISIS